ncbi:MAG: hypothetical protein ABSD31_01040 [Candidatus Binataceae bacterium]|jgi:hypothetical protein
MDGYRYLIERNRLMFRLEEGLTAIRHLPEAEKSVQAARLQAEFDRELRALYREVEAEYPGERRKRACPIDEKH